MREIMTAPEPIEAPEQIEALVEMRSSAPAYCQWRGAAQHTQRRL
jgi:hypothetical protein